MKQRFLFALTALTVSFLLFLLEPMAAKALLPYFGGSQNVWNVCLVFYQTTLLAGYAYADLIRRRFSPLDGKKINAVLLLLSALLYLPLGVNVPACATLSPVLSLLISLFRSVFLPFMLLSAASPLLQSWFATSDNYNRDNPYFLYRYGNLGSFLALLVYPFYWEPHFSLTAICRIWTVGYLFAVFLLWRRQKDADKNAIPFAGDTAAENADPPSGKRKLLWLACSFVPSALLVGVTGKLTADIAPMPLLWAIPLGIYLLSFEFAFTDTMVRLKKIAGDFHLLFLSLLLLFMASANGQIFVLLLFHLAAFAFVCLWCHLRLYEKRPLTGRYLTVFYFYVALGGALGGVFSSLFSPLLFNDFHEYALLLIASLALRDGRAVRTKDTVKFAVMGVAYAAALFFLFAFAHGDAAAKQTAFFMISAVLLGLNYWHFRNHAVFCVMIAIMVVAAGMWRQHCGTDRVILSGRSFYSVYKVIEKGGRYRVLQHGNIYHGAVDLTDPSRGLTYYSPSSPLSLVMSRLARNSFSASSVALVGMGVGSAACYARPGEKWDIYELDAAIAELSTVKGLFPFLKNCAPDAGIIIGDGRIALAAADKKYDVIIVDVFSSDAIPMHLLTKEAVRSYLDHLTGQGILLFHISNNYVDIESVLGAIAADLKAPMLVKDDTGHADGDLTAFNSSWAAIGENELPADIFSDFRPPRVNQKIGVYTDDYSSVYKAFQFRVKLRHD